MTRMVKVQERHLRELLAVLWACDPDDEMDFCEVCHAYGLAILMAADAGLPTPCDPIKEPEHVC